MYDYPHNLGRNGSGNNFDFCFTEIKQSINLHKNYRAKGEQQNSLREK